MIQTGIYKITNTLNNRFYIGSAKNIAKRWKEHRNTFISGEHTNPFMLADYNKCGADAFIYTILEITTIEDRFDIEQQYLDRHYDKKINCYNIQKKVIVGSGVSKTPVETSDKRSIAAKSHYATLTPEQKEERKKYLVSILPQNASCVLYDIDGNKIVIDNIAKWCADNKIPRANVHHVLNGKRPTVHGYTKEPMTKEYRAAMRSEAARKGGIAVAKKKKTKPKY